MISIKKNLLQIREQIIQTASACSRNPEDISLVAVSKRHSVEFIREAYAAGQRDFGENYAQELRDKAAVLSDLNIRWHYIGHLQRNKVKYVAPAASIMECIDSVRLAGEFSKIALQHNKTVEILLQINIGREAQKYGCLPEDAPQIIDSLLKFDGIVLKGLMAIVPRTAEKEESRKYFRALRQLRDKMGGVSLLPHLSMGMSNDFDVAIEEGATIIRVGTAIFGARNT